MTCSGGDSAQGADEAARPRTGAAGAGAERRASACASSCRTAATVANPIDYTAMIWGDGDALAELVRTIGEDPAIGQVLVFYDQPAGADRRGRGILARGSRRDHRRRAATARRRRWSPRRSPSCSTTPPPGGSLSAGCRRSPGLRTGIALRGRDAHAARRPRAAARDRRVRAGRGDRDGAGAEQRDWLGEHETKRLLRAAGVNVVDGRLVTDGDDAARALEELGGAIALKLSAASVQHKSELGGGDPGARDRAERARGVRATRRRSPRASRARVLAERMADPGVELLIAARHDAVVPASDRSGSAASGPSCSTTSRSSRCRRRRSGSSGRCGRCAARPVLLGGRGRRRCGRGRGGAARASRRRAAARAALALIELNPVLVKLRGARARRAAIVGRRRESSGLRC